MQDLPKNDNNRERLKKRIQSALAVCATIAVVVGLLSGIRLIFTSVSSAIIAAFLALMGTVVAAAITSYYTKALEQRNLIDQKNREVKLPAYEGFVEMLINAAVNGGTPREDKLKAWFLKFNKTVMIWGSDDFILEFARWRKASSGNGTTSESDLADPMRSIHDMEKLLFAMRREFGHRNKGLSQGDLMRLLINDYDSAANNSMDDSNAIESNTSKDVTEAKTKSIQHKPDLR